MKKTQERYYGSATNVHNWSYTEGHISSSTESYPWSHTNACPLSYVDGEDESEEDSE